MTALVDLASPHDWALLLAVPSPAGSILGRVTRPGTVVTTHGEISCNTSACVTGDWVHLTSDGLVAPLGRRNELRRQAAGRTSHEQVLASNIDAVLVVEPAYPKPNVRRIERLLSLAFESGARPTVVVTKSDVAEPDALAGLRDELPGHQVLKVSATTGHGLADVRAVIGMRETFVLLGPSGAGKSTLVNALAGTAILATGAVREDGRGRHTTTRRELVAIPGLGVLIDTPGVREVGMIGTHEGIDKTFDDIADLAKGCRFADCAHTQEPGCAVRTAVHDGTVDARRVDAYRRLQRESQQQATRKQVRSRRDERLETKERHVAKRTVMDAKGRRAGR